MQEPSAIHHTFVIERTYPKPPERVFAAFADATKTPSGLPKARTMTLRSLIWIFGLGARTVPISL